MTNKITFTRDNIVIDRDIDFEEDMIVAAIETWLDIEKKFDIKLEDDSWVNTYAIYYPHTENLEVVYYIDDPCIQSRDEIRYNRLKESERKLILDMMNEIMIKDTGSTVMEYWNRFCSEENI